MALTAATASDYERKALQQQQLYAFWINVGDTARAHLALNVGNWYNLQLGLDLYQPADDPSYTPNPTSPTAGAAAAASLPLLTADTFAAAAGNAGAGAGAPQAGSVDLTRKFPQGISTGAPGDSSQAQSDQPFIPDPIDYNPPDGLNQYCMAFPNDPICANFGYQFMTSGGDTGPTTIVEGNTTIIINENGVTAGTVASMIAGALGSAANAIASAVNAGLAAVVAGIQNALNAIGNALVSVFHLLSRLAGLILKFLQGLLLDVIHGIVAAVNAIGQLLKDVFTNVLVPALHALQNLRNYLIRIYQRFLRPLLIWIQDVRKVLAILRVFHVGFATKLDNVLADIQAKISGPLLYLMGWVNNVANYINLILDYRLLIQRPLWLASLAANVGSSLNLQLNAMTKPVDPAALAAVKAAGTAPAPAQSVGATVQLLNDGTGDYAPIVTAQASQLDAYLTQGFE